MKNQLDIDRRIIELGLDPYSLEGGIAESVLVVQDALQQNLELWGKKKETGAVAVARITIDSAVAKLRILGKRGENKE